jgi:hypothetical protein
MVEISITDDHLHLEVKGFDKLWAFKSQLDIPLRHIRGVRRCDASLSMALRDRHSNDPRPSRLEEKTNGPNDVTVAFSNIEVIADRKIGRFDVVQIGIARFINESKVLRQAVQDDLATFWLIATIKTSDIDRHC